MTIESQPRSLAPQNSQKSHLSVQLAGLETLVYDERRHLAFCLDQVAAAVWVLANGRRSTTQIAAAATLQLARPVTEPVIRFALAQLEQDGLMAATDAALVPNAPVPNAVSRRTMLAGAGAGAALLLPVIAVIAAPKAAQAYNGSVDGAIIRNKPTSQQSTVQHGNNPGIPAYDPNHTHEASSAGDEEKSSPEVQQ